MSEFIGACKQKKVNFCITKTVEDEASDSLLKIVNRYFDRARVFAPFVRQSIYLKIKKRLTKLIDHADNLEVKSSTAEVQAFYNRSENQKKLRALKQKKSRVSLMPSLKDMKILSEAIELNNISVVYLVSDDGDFLDFKVELNEEFNLIIVELLNLRQFVKNTF